MCTMDPKEYKELHENFMKNNNGTTIEEVFLTIVPTCFTTFLAANLLLVAHPVSTLAAFFIEFVFVVFSTILYVTVWHFRIQEIALTLCGIALTAAFKQLHSRWHFVPFIQVPCRRPEYFNILRANINLLTAVCILAVDFKCFPRKLAKTESYGFGLMDVGVGLFVYGNGIVAPEIHQPDGSLRLTWQRVERTLWSCVPLIVLGVARFTATNELDYQQHVSEYGVHWNFFLTLAITKCLGTLIIGAVASLRYLKVVAIALLFVHEMILHVGATQYVIDPEKQVQRDGFLNANREGICSILGYVSLYLMAVYVGYFLKADNEDEPDKPLMYTNVRTVLWKVVFLAGGSAALWKITYSLKSLVGVSRRLANIGYVFWSLSIGTTVTALFMLLECFFYFRMFDQPSIGDDAAGPKVNEVDIDDPELHTRPYAPIILSAISYNGLAFFLLANLMTGIVNLSMQTLLQDTLTAMVILTAYALILCSTITFLYLKRIKLKIW